MLASVHAAGGCDDMSRRKWAERKNRARRIIDARMFFEEIPTLLKATSNQL